MFSFLNSTNVLIERLRRAGYLTDADASALQAHTPHLSRGSSMTTARLADMEAAIRRDEATNPDAYYEYEGTIDESHQRAKLADDDATLPTGGPAVNYGAAGI